jgi:hypothetical protein
MGQFNHRPLEVHGFTTTAASLFSVFKEAVSDDDSGFIDL